MKTLWRSALLLSLGLSIAGCADSYQAEQTEEQRELAAAQEQLREQRQEARQEVQTAVQEAEQIKAKAERQAQTIVDEAVREAEQEVAKAEANVADEERKLREGLNRQPAAPEATQTEDAPRGETLASPVQRASTLVGAEVRNPQNEELGEIADLVVDQHTGEVRYAVLSFGGLLGVGEKLFAVPFGALMPTQRDGEVWFTMDIDRERLKSAPGFDKDNWPDFADRTFTSSIDEHYRISESPAPSRTR